MTLAEPHTPTLAETLSGAPAFPSPAPDAGEHTDPLGARPPFYLSAEELWRADELRSAILDARIATTDVSSFASFNVTVDEGLAAAERLAVASAKIKSIVQGAYNASP